MGGYVGSAEDQRRILRQQKERDQHQQQIQDARKKAEAAANAGLRQFGAGTTEALEHAFKTETVGLVTREEFVEKRQTIAERLDAEAKRQRDAAEEAAWRDKEAQRAKRAKAEQKNKLSFGDDFDDDDNEGEGQEVDDMAPKVVPRAPAQSAGAPAAATPPPERRYATLGKDPTVRADFLPDRDRDRKEEELRAALRKEWALQQAAIKAEPLGITYSYWNGSGHRRQVTVRKGDTIGAFLKAVQEQLAPQFREIRTATSSGLMYVKEDIILPHNVTFYELIIRKAQGKSGPLFQFDLQEVAATAFDPRMKSQDSHAGKVVERHWYSRNKHIFPYSRWEVYDPDKHAAAAAQDEDNAT